MPIKKLTEELDDLLLTKEEAFEVEYHTSWEEYKKQVGASDALLIESYLTNFVETREILLCQVRKLEDKGCIRLPTKEEVVEFLRKWVSCLNPDLRDYLLIGAERLYTHLGGERFIQVKGMDKETF